MAATSGVASGVAQVLKASLNVQTLALQNAEMQQLQQSNFTQFGDFLNGQVQEFLTQAHSVEKRVKNYGLGQESIEQIAPLVAELGLEVEAKTKIIDALTNIVKTLTSMQM